MDTVRLFVAGGFLIVATLAGCNGPTKSGLEARDAARTRLDLFNSELTYDQARQAFEVGRFEDALKNVTSAIQLEPERSKYRVLEGRIFLETHRLERAIASFVKAIEVNEADHEAHYYAGIVFQRWSDDEQAYEHYVAASRLDPANVQYLLAAAEALIAMGEFEAARELIEPKLDYFEHNAALHHLLGQISLLEGDGEQAVVQLTRARMLDPEDEHLLEQLARVQFDTGHYPGCYQSLLELMSRLEHPRLDLKMLEARCLAMMGRTSEARDIYLTLSQKHPADVNVWIELGTVAWEMGDYHRVAQCSVRIIALAPDRFEGYMLRGSNERHHGNLERAVRDLRAATERAPNSPMPHLMLGMTLEELGDVPGALSTYQYALRIDPDNAEARMLLERLRGSSGRVTAVPSSP